MRFLALALSLLMVLPAQAQLLPSFGRDRSGTVGFQFLKLAPDARSLGLGQAVTTTATDASSLFWNPALSAQATGPQVGMSHIAWYEGGLFSTNYMGATLPIGSYTVGISVQSMDSGEMPVTTEFRPEGTGEQFRVVDMAAGLTLSQRLTDIFSYGVTAKVVHESVFELSTTSVAFDFGIYYAVGSTGAKLGVAVRNFGLDAAPKGSITRTDPNGVNGIIEEDQFETITMPTTFLLGLSYDAVKTEQHELVVSTQLYRPNDNAESLGLGAEYTFNRLLTLRGGYRLGVSEYVGSFGGALRIPALGAQTRIDYGFSRLERLGNIHAVGLNIGF